MNDSFASQQAPYIQAVLGKKAEDIVLLDVRGLTTLADAFLICSGRSHRQVTAIAEHTLRDLKKNGIRPLSTDGLQEGHWVLLDYGHIIIHVFYDPVRRFYDLEGLWSDAKRIQLQGDEQPSARSGDSQPVDEIFIE
jgi:ribosome-associated protein